MKKRKMALAAGAVILAISACGQTESAEGAQKDAGSLIIEKIDDEDEVQKKDNTNSTEILKEKGQTDESTNAGNPLYEAFLKNICFDVFESHTRNISFGVYDYGLVWEIQNYDGFEMTFYSYTEDGQQVRARHFTEENEADMAAHEGEEPEWIDWQYH